MDLNYETINGATGKIEEAIKKIGDLRTDLTNSSFESSYGDFEKINGELLDVITSLEEDKEKFELVGTSMENIERIVRGGGN